MYFEAVASVRPGDARDGVPSPAVPTDPSDIALVSTRCCADPRGEARAARSEGARKLDLARPGRDFHLRTKARASLVSAPDRSDVGRRRR